MSVVPFQSEVLYPSQIGFNDGIPITEEFGIKNIAGKSNEDVGRVLFPDSDQEKITKFFEEKEAMFCK